MAFRSSPILRLARGDSRFHRADRAEIGDDVVTGLALERVDDALGDGLRRAGAQYSQRRHDL